MTLARAETRSQHMGSAYKDYSLPDAAGVDTTLTPRERNAPQHGASRSRENRLGMPILHHTATRCNTFDQTENHGVPGSNPGPATTTNRLSIAYTSLVTLRGGAFLCGRVPLCAAGWLSTWLSDRPRSHDRRSLLKYQWPERS